MTKKDALETAYLTWCRSVANELRTLGLAVERVTNDKDMRRAFDSGNDSVKVARFYAKRKGNK